MEQQWDHIKIQNHQRQNCHYIQPCAVFICLSKYLKYLCAVILTLSFGRKVTGMVPTSPQLSENPAPRSDETEGQSESRLIQKIKHRF